MRIACVGESTAEVFRSHCLEVEIVAEKSTAENLAKELVATDSLDSANVLVVTGNRNSEVLVQMLEDIGHAIVDTLPLYETDFTDVTDAEDLKKFRKMGADAIIFTSSSTALSYIEQEDDLVLDQERSSRSFAVLALRLAKPFLKMNLLWNWSVPSPVLTICPAD